MESKRSLSESKNCTSSIDDSKEKEETKTKLKIRAECIIKSSEPKVFVPFVSKSGLPPREVALERKRRQYQAHDINRVLLEQNLNYNTMELDGKPLESDLDLMLFDNQDFETFHNDPERWVQKGESRGVPARALRPSVGHGFGMEWIDVVVVGVDEKGYFQVVWQDRVGKTEEEEEDDDGRPKMSLRPRLRVLFDAEDPIVFAERLLFAERARRRAKEKMRHEIFVDCMPNEDVTTLRPEMRRRIADLAKATCKSLRSLSHSEARSMIDEVAMDFCRSMNRMTYTASEKEFVPKNLLSLQSDLEIQGVEDLAKSRKLVTQGEDREYTSRLNAERNRGVIPQGTIALQCGHDASGNMITQDFDFASASSHFAFRTLFTQPEIITMLVRIQQQCKSLLDRRVFKLSGSATQSQRLEDFESSQGNHLREFVSYVDKEWIENICNCIMECLSGVSKGWFKIDETDENAYKMSNLRFFFQFVNFMIQDTLRDVVMKSLQEYRDMILRGTAAKSSLNSNTKLAPLFLTHLSFYSSSSFSGHDEKMEKKSVAEDDDKTIKIGYKDTPEKIAKSAIRVIRKALESLEGISQVERRVMNKLFWSSTPTVRAVQYMEPCVQKIVKQIAKHLRDSIVPVNEYKKQYEQYMEFLRVDENEYLTELIAKYVDDDDDDDDDNDDSAKTSSKTESSSSNKKDTLKRYEELSSRLTETQLAKLVVKIKELVVEHSEKAKNLEKTVPAMRHMKMFAVNCSDFRNHLIEKRQKLSSMMLLELAKKNVQATNKLLETYSEIQRSLKRETNNIEELTELEEYMSDVTKQLDGLKERGIRVLEKYELLDGFKYQLDRNDFFNKYHLFGYPKVIHDLLQEVRILNVTKRAEYLEEMNVNQSIFGQNLQALSNEVNNLSQFNDVGKVDSVSTYIQKLKTRLADARKSKELFNSREGLFGKDITTYESLATITKTFEPYCNMWETVNNWIAMEKRWLNDHFLTIDAEDMEKKLDDFTRKLFKSSKIFQINKIEGCNKIATDFLETVREFKKMCPLVVTLRNPGMRQRHWDKINTLLPQLKESPIVAEDPKFNLQTLIDLKIPESAESISKVGEAAGKEFQIEKALNQMREEWEDVMLTIEPYGDTGTCILKEVDVVIQLLDEQVTMTQAMTFSSFKGPFEDDITAWDKTLNTVSELIDEWLAVQRSWLYLQPIFDSEDIKKQLPTESKRFANVNKTWRTTMRNAQKNPKAIEFCDSVKLYDQFVEGNKFLDLVQKGLSDYLETKRAGFSRFYFLSNDELLEILSETKNPRRVQPHLKKCFEAIKSVRFEEDLSITAMISREKEKVELLDPIQTTGKNVENWMSELEEAMCNAVRARMFESVLDYVQTPRTEWMQIWPGQCVLNGSQVHWTRETETALDENGVEGLKKYYKQQLAQLEDMVRLVRDPSLSRLAKKSISSLAVIDVHAKDVAAKMIENKVSSKNAFDWILQMRYYWEKSEVMPWTIEKRADELDREDYQGDCKVLMVSSKRPYSYEYLGNSFRLVITPLTDKCYLTLMGALQMILGGAPAGPAGTGKTETTKDLAKALAKQCVVFNCSDGMDFKMTAKFFKGLASCGAWCCFDEFNRIHIEVLSVIAQQIMTLQKGVILGQTRIVFYDTDMKLNGEFAIYITMNPGYAGRTELPDNLKALFRPVAMMVPDYALIGEIMLFAFGFSEARSCARKMVATFRLCSEQLSSQDHYDYGMRAVKTVIVAAGNLKREYPDEDEELIMLRGLMDVNLPKFLAHDLPLFKGIMSDLFPGKSKPDIDYGTLYKCIKLSCEAKNLQIHPWFIEKVIQLYEMIVVRHGLMVVGPAGGGKTSNIRVLEMALTMLKKYKIQGKRYEKVLIKYINPKSITMGQLYGSFDENTHEWRDGVLANMIRVCSKINDSSLKWVLFDGPVDTLWIESMNTVLDDNKKLCLNSGEIVPLSDEMTMMFEPADLAVASPATVSRCGMIYMEPKSLGLEPARMSWMKNLPRSFRNEHRAKIKLKMDRYLTPSLSFLRRNLKEIVPSVNNNLSQSWMRLLDCYFQRYRYTPGVDEPPSEEDLDALSDTLDPILNMSFIWSVMCTVNAVGRRVFDTYFRGLLAAEPQSHPIPDSGLVYDFYFDEKDKTWHKWMDMAQDYVHSKTAKFSDLIVETTDTTRYTYLLKTLHLQGHHIMMCGDTGTGKTININKYLSSGMPQNYIPVMAMFSAQTTQNMTQDLIDSKCEKRRKGVYGPMAGKKYALFVDDVNMPEREIFFAQPPIELLRQWLCVGGWYDRKTLRWRQIIDTQLIVACGPPGGGRNPVTPRFWRHFNMIAYTPMDDSVMFTIFDTILKNFLIHTGFEEELATFSNDFVWSTITVYNTITQQLLPTPKRPHYTFNLRDIGKVFQGLLQANRGKIKTKLQLSRMWVHECRRVFSDRLINDHDRDWFETQIVDQLETRLKLKKQDVLPGDLLIFADFMIPGADPRIYCEVEDRENLIPIVEEYLADFNAETKTPMNLVIFTDAVKHISRISRIIRQEGGNALLMGVGGSGRQSLTHLAAFICEYEVFQPKIAKGYGKAEWREDLRSCLLKAGVDDKPVVFLFVDTQVVFEGMLEDFNNILNSGDVANLYGPEEMESIISACRVECQRNRIPATKINIFAAYIRRVRRNIHCVLAMSPIGESFRRRLRMFPSLVNCCTIDWFSKWPSEALLSVAKSSMMEGEGMDLNTAFPHVIDFFRVIHESVATHSDRYLNELGRHNYVTPTSYLELLSTYKKVIKTKRHELGSLKTKLQNGLDKLRSAENDVADLQKKIVKMQPELAHTSEVVAKMIENINKEKEEANEFKLVVEKKEAEASEQAKQAESIAESAQRDLDEALPALEEAVQCLSSLKKDDIDEVRSMKTPPSGVKLTMEVSCLMFGVKPVMEKDPDNLGKKIKNYWTASKTKLLNNPKAFLNMLIDYDKDNIDPKVVKKLAHYVDMEEFTPKSVKKASEACTAICMWARAMYKYDCVAREVEPKRKLLAEAQESYAETMEVLNEAQIKLKEVNDRIEKLESDLQKNVDKKDELARQMQLCKDRLKRADILISGLSGEKKRWIKTTESLGVRYEALIGDCLVAAGTASYLGPFTPSYRREIVREWLDAIAKLNQSEGKGESKEEKCLSMALPVSSDVSITKVLGDPVQIRSWNIVGLPTDGHSIENAIIMNTARRWPLFIDPQMQANRFVRKLSKEQCEHEMDVIKLTDQNFLRTLENGVRFGKWVLLENIQESLDAALEPILQQQTFKQGGTTMIRIGDSTIPYNDTFRFFMSTKLPNPHYPPEVCVKVTLLNFTITPKGLEDQLLGIVIVKEKPELEEQKNELVLQNSKMTKSLKDIEDNILKLLSESTGNILDDIQLIDTLAESKKTSEQITEQVEQAKETEKKIDMTRELYRSVAYRGSLLYFCVTDLALIDPMYQYSLQWYANLFTRAISEAEKSDDIETRKQTLISYFTMKLYTSVCRSLFEKSKLLFSFLMCISILKGENKIDLNEWKFLISGLGVTSTSSGNETSKDVKNPAPEWITQRNWKEICTMSTLQKFQGFHEGFQDDLKHWKAYFDDKNPHTFEFPERWKDTNLLQRMCVLRAMRPDKVSDAIVNYVIHHLGQKFVEPPPFDLSLSFDDSSPQTPLIFVLTAGSDPTKTFQSFASKMGMGNKFEGISLGQGQDKVAEAMIQSGRENGTWVYLQNCHLYVSWMIKLEQICESFKEEDSCHKNFRLWLTSMPSKAFPVAVLQNGVKMTVEPPKGLKQNLKNQYFKLDNSKLMSHSKPKKFNKLFFALCFFHASVQDRRKFGSLGWNIPYDFNDTDIEISKSQLENFLDVYDEVPYWLLTFLISYINYGGRVTDYIDLRTIDVILRNLFVPEIMTDDYKFSDSGLYYSVAVQDSKPQSSYMDYIETLPLNPDPEAFGLNANASIICAENETSQIFNTILSLESTSSSGGASSGGRTRDEIVDDIAAQIEARMPEAFDVEAVSMMYPLSYNESMNTVLVQELMRYNNIIVEINKTLPQLRKALKGLVVMSVELEAMGNALETQGIPPNWQRHAYPSLKALNPWFDEFMQRLEFLQSWIDNGIPAAFWLPGFFFPQAFFTGTKQNYARQKQIPIDTLDFDFEILKETDETKITTRPESGCIIYGLYLEGARFNTETMQLDDSIPKQLYVPGPIIYLKPKADRKLPEGGIYRCPVYKELSRRGTLSTTGHSTNFVLWVELPGGKKDIKNNLGLSDQEYWIKAGVAMFCSLRY